MTELAETTVVNPLPGRTFLGQPLGLATCFLTEMGERFTFYGMRSVLILFMVATRRAAAASASMTRPPAPSTGCTSAAPTCSASSAAGSPTACSARSARCSPAASSSPLGNALLALGNSAVFFIGLIVIVMGVGLLKPNVSGLVASLYPEGGSRRDAGFSIFYMGINSGALLGPILVPLGRAPATASTPASCCRRSAWRSASRSSCGRAASCTARDLPPAHAARLVDAGDAVPRGGRAAGGRWRSPAPFASNAALAGLVRLLGVRAAGRWPTSSTCCSSPASTPSSASARWVMVALFVASVTFWLGYEQQGASFNLFAERYTDLHLFGVPIAAGKLQAASPIFVITFARRVRLAVDRARPARPRLRRCRPSSASASSSWASGSW